MNKVRMFTRFEFISEDWRFIDWPTKSSTGSLVIPRYLRIEGPDCPDDISTKIDTAASLRRIQVHQKERTTVILHSPEDVMNALIRHRDLSVNVSDAVANLERTGIPYRSGTTRLLYITDTELVSIVVRLDKPVMWFLWSDAFHVDFYYAKFSTTS